MSNKNYLILIIVVTSFLLVIFGFILYVFSGGKTSSNSPVGSSSQPKIFLQGKSGIVEVNNFEKDSEVFDRVVLMHSETDFSIQYDKVDNNFQITINSADVDSINSIRLVAEDTLSRRLGLEAQQLCALEVGEVVPETESFATEKGVYLPSFCPGGGERIQ